MASHQTRCSLGVAWWVVKLDRTGILWFVSRLFDLVLHHFCWLGVLFLDGKYEDGIAAVLPRGSGFSTSKWRCAVLDTSHESLVEIIWVYDICFWKSHDQGLGIMVCQPVMVCHQDELRNRSFSSVRVDYRLLSAPHLGAPPFLWYILVISKSANGAVRQGSLVDCSNTCNLAQYCGHDKIWKCVRGGVFDEDFLDSSWSWFAVCTECTACCKMARYEMVHVGTSQCDMTSGAGWWSSLPHHARWVTWASASLSTEPKRERCRSLQQLGCSCCNLFGVPFKKSQVLKVLNALQSQLDSTSVFRRWH